MRDFTATNSTETGATPASGNVERRSRAAKVPDEYAVHLFMDGGHREEVRFQNLDDFKQWYQTMIKANPNLDEFVGVPIKTAQGEMMVVRPARISGIRVEPVYATSLDRY